MVAGFQGFISGGYMSCVVSKGSDGKNHLGMESPATAVIEAMMEGVKGYKSPAPQKIIRIKTMADVPKGIPKERIHPRVLEFINSNTKSRAA
jgi:hypothetical protein